MEQSNYLKAFNATMAVAAMPIATMVKITTVAATVATIREPCFAIKFGIINWQWGLASLSFMLAILC